ncbi:MAG: DNA translocase FtsK, partial [Oscillospiraceae bacterium]|nr:DNA translocase FtsK [Oscillospiraceae bacterium]
MATQTKSKKKKSTPKSSATATEINKMEAERRRQMTAGKRQITAIILFAVSIFLLSVVFIKGQYGWLALHNFMFGLFGVCAYIWPLLLGFVAVLCAMDKLYDYVSVKVIECSALIGLIGGAVDIFSTHVEGQKFFAHFIYAFKIGKEIKGGGLVGSILGHPLYCLFGKVGAGITICLLIFVFFMLITGTTLVSLFKTLIKPVAHMGNAAESAYSQHIERRVEKAKFNVDVPLDDIEERQKKPKDELSDKKKKLLDAYRGVISSPSVADQADQQPIPAEEVSAPPFNGIKTAENQESKLDPDLIDKINKSIQNKRDSNAAASVAPPRGSGMIFDTASNSYRYPPVSLLAAVKVENDRSISAELEATATRLVDTLRSFGVETRIINISRGPSVTRYELQPSAGVKISKITNLADDIALNLATAGVRIEAPIPNKPAVGIEVPNKNVSMVGVREMIDSPAFANSKSKLTIALGKDIAGAVTVADIAKMPHGLIAGATGSGKSVCINSFIISLLYKATPDEVKLLMIDPKVVELGVYNGIPHLLVPVVTDPRKAAGALGWAVTEMEKRYKIFAENDVRNLEGYNKLASKREDLIKIPHIVIIIDELADLMMTAPGEVEDAICRIAQKARAAGMHLIIATQRPSVDVVTGLIKANIPTRIAFAVSSQIDSRTILDMGGAEKLMGRGDMLFYPVGSIKPRRVQGCFVSDEEVEAVVDFIKGGHTSDYDEDVMIEIERQAAKEKSSKSGLSEDRAEDDDPMLKQAIEVVVEAGSASTSLLQRRLKLGYARAARIVDEMEARGIVGPHEGSKPR